MRATLRRTPKARHGNEDHALTALGHWWHPAGSRGFVLVALGLTLQSVGSVTLT